MRRLVVTAFAATTVVACAKSPATEPPRRPNVLLILADDLGYTDLGVLGSEIRTPNLDRLAREGLLLTRFYVSPACSPTRAMLLSGASAQIAGLGTMAGEQSPEQVGRTGYEGYLTDRVVSLATLLREGGYQTSVAGKWHLGGAPGQGPEDRGFERSFVLVGGGASHFDDAATLTRSDRRAAYREDGEPVASLPEGFYSSDAYTDHLIGYMREARDAGRPFFAYAAFTSPHWPLQVPDADLGLYRGRYDEGYEALLRRRFQSAVEAGLVPAGDPPPLAPYAAPWDALGPEERAVQSRTMEVYAAMVENLDRHVGRLLRSLEETGQLDDTLVLFFSDNGAEGNPIGRMAGNAEWIPERFDNRLENLGRRGSYAYLGPGWGQAVTGPFRHFKTFASEGGVRVPALVRTPSRGFAAGGRRSGAVVSVLDVAPTVLELAGIGAPGPTWRGRPVASLEGRSMVPLLRGEAETVRGPGDVLGWELFGRRAVLKGDWKLAWTWPPYGPGEWELFDLARDPGERHDLSSREPERRAEMLAAWNAWAARNGVVLPESDSSYAREPARP